MKVDSENKGFGNQPIHYLFEKQVERTPHEVAVVFPSISPEIKEKQELTYSELNIRANQLACHLQRYGVGPEVLVGLYMERSVEMIVGMLGIIKAGGAYLPLDTAYPKERLAFMLKDAQAPVLLSQRHLTDKLPENDIKLICLDSDWETISQESEENLVTAVTPENLIYVIYTSGSTGTPKGAAIPHRGVSRLLIDTNYIQLRSEDIVAQASNASFDAATFEIWGALLHGGKLVGVDQDTALSPQAFAEFLQKEQISVLFLTTALFNQVAEEVPNAFTSLKYLLFGGEAVNPRWVDEILKKGAPEHLLHVYGPTESTTYSTWHEVLEVPENATTIPIGRPISKTEAYILNENLQPVPVKVSGELYIGGLGLARCYLNREELTTEKFIKDPFSDDPEKRLYKTGDLARYLPDGNIEFVGRIDHQIKIRGYRVELGEIETRLSRHANVQQNIVILREDHPGDKRIVAYLVLGDGKNLTSHELRTALKKKLPDYMVPSAFVFMDALPLNPNGKVDRKALPIPEAESTAVKTDFVAPRNSTETIIAEICKEVLSVPIGVNDNFIELGGHSLLAVQATTQLRKSLLIDLPISMFFQLPTVAQQAKWVDNASKNEGEQLPPIRVHPKNTTEMNFRNDSQAVSQNEVAPLSFPQQQLWFFNELHPFEPVYNETIVIHMRETVDAAVLEKSLNELVQRHEMLRTTFAAKNGEPVQITDPPKPLRLAKVDLCHLPNHERENEAHRLATKELIEGFDLERGPLLRTTLAKLDEEDWRLYFSGHHIILDGVSMYNIFLPELDELYRVFSLGKPSPLQELPIKYGDFARWQRQSLIDYALSKQLDYWKQKLANLSTLQLPTDHPYSSKTTYRGARQCLALSKNLTMELSTMSRREGTTLFMTLVTAFNALLYRYTSQEDITIGTVTDGRNQVETQGIMGNFLNNLVLRTDLSGDPSFRELLKRVKKVTLEAYQNQDVPFEKIVAALQPERTANQNPLFQVAFVLEPVLPDRNSKWSLSQLDIHTKTAKFDITFELDNRPEGIIGRVEYSTDLFEDSTITRMIGHFETLLEQIVVDPDEKISLLPLLTKDERHQLLVEWNPGTTVYPHDKCIHHLFEKQVEKTPDSIALIYPQTEDEEEQQVTYRELNQRANQVAHHLQKLGVGPDNMVGICVERSIEMVVGILGILKAGGAYVPLDPAYPKDRLSFILEDAQVLVLLTQNKLASDLPETNAHLVYLDSDNDPIVKAPVDNPQSQVDSDNLAYVIYTSGSTGKPKGVLINHSNVARLLAATDNWYQFDENDVWPLFHSFAFDVSVWEFWCSLLYGGSLVIVPYLTTRSPQALYNLLCQYKVTVFNQTPSAFRQFVAVDEMQGTVGDLNLRYIIFAGEILDFQSLRPWIERHGDQSPVLVNMYGITETTVHVTYRPLAKADLGRKGSMVGCAIPDLEIYILDQCQQPVPIGIPGEIHVGGPGLARGYLNRPELTEERFIENPFSDEPGSRLYKSGDLARYLANGDIECLGRIDKQVKIRGFRIELGEIEEVLSHHKSLQANVVVGLDDPSDGGRRLVGYIVPKFDKPPTTSDLRRFVKEKLPEYMVPTTFVAMDKLPLTNNGKVDYRALPAPEQLRPELDTHYVAPTTPEEKLLAEIWAEILGIEEVGVGDNFFELGGDSMRAVQVAASADQNGLALSVHQLFQHQTIEKLARLCGQKQQVSKVSKSEFFSFISENDRKNLPDDVEDAYPLSVLQAGMIFHTEHDPGTDVYHDLMGSRVNLPLDINSLSASLEELTKRHPVLRTSVAMAKFSEPLQLVHREVEVPISVEDLRDLSFAEQEKVIDEWFSIEKRRAFDWEKPPLLCVKIHQRESDCFNITLSFHHIILEGWSIATFLTEFFQLYLSKIGRDVPPLPLPPASFFRDSVMAERKIVQSEKAKAYWVEKFSNKATTRLPRWPKSYRKDGQPNVLEIRVSPDVSKALKKLAQTAQVPFKSVLLAAHIRMLSMQCNLSDVTTGLVTNTRPEEKDSERVLGLYLNTLPFSLELNGGTWIELAQETFEAEHADIAYREYPLAEIQRNIGKPLFETIFNIVHFHVYNDLLKHEGLDGINEKVFQRTNFPLLTSFVLEPISAQLERLVIDYDGSQLCEEQVKGIGDCYLEVLEVMAQQPEARYESFTTTSQKRLIERNHVRPDVQEEGCVHKLFEAQVERTPDNVAISFYSLDCQSEVEEKLTYQQLNDRANQLAHHLKQFGVGPETRVGICIDRSPEMLVGMLGTLKAGGAYVPLDITYPKERLAFMLDDAQIKVLLTQEKLLEQLPEHNTHIVCLDKDWEAISQLPQENPVNSAKSDNLAYVTYTSGSTGKPKGVAIEHSGVVTLLSWAKEQFSAEELAGVFASTSINFDLSVFELFTPLTLGEKVILAKNILHLPNFPETEKITLINTVPSAMTQLMEIDGIPASVRVVNLAGEPLNDALVQRVYARETVEKVFNLYGPTEDTTYSTAALMKKGENAPVTIGKPILGVEVIILDIHLQPVPTGVVGELCLGGVGLARGYLDDPDLTAKKFIRNPFGGDPSARLYKTGDLARYLPDGNIQLLGRVDYQIKLRGYRIEMGEIEATLMQHTTVREAVVTALENKSGNKCLAAYIVEKGEKKSSTSEIRDFLAKKLPAHMIPATFTVLKSLPLTPNGKIDRRSLPAANTTSLENKSSHVAPRNAVERHLAKIWEHVLDIEVIGVQDNFFSLGGHSLLAVSAIARIQQEMKKELPLATLFESPTIEQLADILRDL